MGYTLGLHHPPPNHLKLSVVLLLCNQTGLTHINTCLQSNNMQLLLPKEPGVEREAVSWFGKVYPRTRAAEWPAARPMDIIQV